MPHRTTRTTHRPIAGPALVSLMLLTSAGAVAPAHSAPGHSAPGHSAPGHSAPGHSAQAAALAPDCGAFFDDFAYSDRDDPDLHSHGWVLRSGGGGPGVAGANGWSREQISFLTLDGQRVARLTARTDGTAEGTSQAELAQQDLRFREGTYAARIRFSDDSVSGSGTARPNQTFYALSPLRYDWDPDYSELDFAEYLAQGGWGSDGPALFTTSYHSYQADPWEAENVSDVRAGSLDGWHQIGATATDGVVRYYLDGDEVAVHDADSSPYDVFPRSDMALAFNHWFIDLGDDPGRGAAEYQEHVDWVFYEAGTTRSPQEVAGEVASYRSASVTHDDTLADCAG